MRRPYFHQGIVLSAIAVATVPQADGQTTPSWMSPRLVTQQRSAGSDMAAGKGSMFRAYTDPTSAEATALPSGMAVAASFDPQVATDFGHVIAREMNNLALHVFEAPGMNLARLPILGRNFEYFGEDPYLSGVMAVAETRSVQAGGIIAMRSTSSRMSRKPIV